MQQAEVKQMGFISCNSCWHTQGQSPPEWPQVYECMDLLHIVAGSCKSDATRASQWLDMLMSYAHLLIHQWLRLSSIRFEIFTVTKICCNNLNFNVKNGLIIHFGTHTCPT